MVLLLFPLVILTPAAAAEDRMAITYFYLPGCKICERFLDEEIPRLERETGVDIDVELKNLRDSREFAEFQRTALDLEVEVTRFPVVVVGKTLLQGEREIIENLEKMLRGVKPDAEEIEKHPAAKLRLIPVILAGLLDGINPCAFTTLIFLIAALSVAGRGRREILLIGLFFALSVFVTYFLIGVGLFEAFRIATASRVVSTIFRWVLFSVLVAFAIVSVYDWGRIRAGRTDKVVLQLPTAIKRRIHASIRAQVKSTALIVSSLAMGFLVSIFELACTGQIYFPTIGFLIESEGGARNYLYLGIYNVGFVLPLLVVFCLVYFGVSSKRITALFQARMGAVKLATAALFAGLACLTVLT
jgi:cytochrome c biogenesis protein CcdA